MSEQLCILGHCWRHGFLSLVRRLSFLSDMSSQRNESAELQRCFSRVAHPGSIEDRAGTPLNPPCNSSHKMRSNAPQRQSNIWGVLHYKREIAETQSLEVLGRGERGGWRTRGAGGKMADSRAGLHSNWPFFPNMSHLHQSVQPISNGDAGISQDNMPGNASVAKWLKNKELEMNSGVSHGSPAAFCIADDGGGLIEWILRRETEDYPRVGCHRGRCERRKVSLMRKGKG